jgi:PAS domain S-box-containing protein
MDKINALEQENKELREQLHTAHAEVRKNQQVFQQIEDFSSRLGVTVKLQETHRNCLQLFKDFLGLDVASLFLKESEKDTMIMHDTLGFSESLINKFIISKGVGLPGLVLETLQVETVEDFTTEKRISIPDIVLQENIHSAIAVPMLHNNVLFGIIIGHSKKKISFSKEQQTVSQIFANQSATAIKNAIHIQSLKLADRALLERSNELQSIFGNSMAGIMLLKGNRIITRCNQRLADIMGYHSPTEMKGLSMRELHLSDERYKQVGKSSSTILRAGRQVRQDYQLRKKDGASIWCDISGKALDKSFPPDLSKGIVYIVNDISQRKKLEAQLLKGQKLESLAILTGGLGHDFNNIITAILGNIDLCLAITEPDHKAYAFLQPAKEATLRVRDLTKRLQMLSQPSKPVLSSAPLPEIINDAIPPTLQNEIEITYDFAKDLQQATIDPGQITKAFKYLLANSIQAMPEKGKVHISSNNFVNNGEIAGLRRGNYIQTSIHDNGHGIAPEIFDQIFDPYFTTRGRSKEKGSGLGLATVLSIIKRHHGFITADSNIDEGATFTFYLPTSSDGKKKTSTSKRDKKRLGTGKGKTKILIMDDDESVRLTTQTMLNLIGYQVEVSEDGSAAIECYQSAMDIGAPYDLLIMDLNIPEGMGAIEAAEGILQLDKDARIIVASGDTMNSAMLSYKDYGFSACLAKPFEFEELHSSLAKVLMS